MNLYPHEINPKQLPFDLNDCQSELGVIKSAVLQCPGIYYICTDQVSECPVDPEFYVVTDEAPISMEARTYGKRFFTHSDLLLYPLNDTNRNWMVLEYEINKYRTKNHLPLPEGETLHSTAIFAMECHPEYFGMLPPPWMTSRGYTVRYRVIGNGIYWIETDRCEEVLAVAFPIWDGELSEAAIKVSERAPSDQGQNIEASLGYLFFSAYSSSIPIFEMLQTRPEWVTSGMVNKAALMNAIWNDHPAYALAYNEFEQAGLNDPLETMLRHFGEDDTGLAQSGAHMISFSADAGTAFLNFGPKPKIY